MNEIDKLIEPSVKRAIVWTPLGTTIDAWRSKLVTEHPEYTDDCFFIHQDTLLATEDGVFLCGMIGAMYVGQKEGDAVVGSFALVNMDWNDVIIEYSDNFPDGCYRLPDGRVHCVCEV